MSSLTRQFARLTRSYGFAIILSALVVKLILLPLDWRQARQSQKLRQLQPEIRRLKDEHADYRMYLSEARKLYTDAGIRPLGALASIFLQIPIFVVVFLVIQATSVFTRKSFLWISDLSVPDRLAQIPSLPWLGSDLNLLPWLLMGSIWLFAMTMRGPGQSIGMLGRIIWLLLAIGIGVLTYRWSSALLLFTIALLRVVRFACLARLALPWSFNLLHSLNGGIFDQPLCEGNRSEMEMKLAEYVRRQSFLLKLSEEARELLEVVKS